MWQIHRAAVIIYILRMRLSGKKILLGVTGGIAAYKSCELLRLLQKEGAEVRVAMTPAATTFVGPLTFASLSRYPVFLKSGAQDAGSFQHIEYPRWADFYLVVPCSANTLARFAAGFADEPVSLCFLARTVPAWVAPAMNSAMYLSPAVQANIALLKSRGVKILQAPAGELACGESGPGRCPEPTDILRALIAADEPVPESSPFCAPPNGKRVLITAGRTEEPIDPVRYISNRSSGKTGAALADAFVRAGYAVTVIAGPMEATLPAGVERVPVKSASEMHDAVLERMKTFDAVVHCAAVADYRPKTCAAEKIKDSRSALTLELAPNPNILRDSVAAKRPSQVIVGFALETADAVRHGEEKLKKSGADLLVLNTPVADGSGFGFDKVSYALLEPGKAAPALSLGAKSGLADSVVNFVSGKLGVAHA